MAGQNNRILRFAVGAFVVAALSSAGVWSSTTNAQADSANALTITALVGEGFSSEPLHFDGFSSPPVFTLSPEPVPEGWSFDSNTGALSGVSDVALHANWVVTASGDGRTITQPLTVHVTPTYRSLVPSLTLSQGLPLEYRPGDARGFPGPVRYSVSPGLPEGIALTEDGVLTGAATAVQGPVQHTFTATSGSWSDEFTLTLSVTDGSSIVDDGSGVDAPPDPVVVVPPGGPSPGSESLTFTDDVAANLPITGNSAAPASSSNAPGNAAQRSPAPSNGHTTDEASGLSGFNLPRVESFAESFLPHILIMWLLPILMIGIALATTTALVMHFWGKHSHENFNW